MQSYSAITNVKRAILAAALILAAATAAAQSSASHRIVMRVIGSNRLSVTRAAVVQSSSLTATGNTAPSIAADPSTVDSRTMNLGFNSSKTAEPRKTVVSVKGVVLPGVTLGMSPAGSEAGGRGSKKSGIGPVPVSYDVSGMVESSASAASAITLTVSVDDPERRAEATSGMIFITYTVI